MANVLMTEAMFYFSLYPPSTELIVYFNSMYLVEWDGIWLTAPSQHCLCRLANSFTYLAQQSLLWSKLTPCSRRQYFLLNLLDGFHPFGFRFSYLFRVVNFNVQTTNPTPFIAFSWLMLHFKINI